MTALTLTLKWYYCYFY